MLPIAICIVLFFDMLIALLVPSTETMIFVTDGSAARYAADFVSMFIGVFVLYKVGWKKLPSVSLLVFMLFMLVSHFHAVNIHFDGLFIPNDMAIYDYKPMLECVLFFMMFMGIYSMEIVSKDILQIKNVLAWSAVASGAFAILQRFHLDQFYKIMDPINIVHMSRNPEVGGFICQPVFCAALLTMLFPFVMKTKSWWKISFVLAGIMATGNRTSLIAVAICALYLLDIKHLWRILLACFIMYLVVGTVLSFYYDYVPHFSEERFKIWHNILTDFVHSRCPGINNSHILTGIGIGSFPVIFPYFYAGWLQAHNEYLECLKGLGVIGLIILSKFAITIPNKDRTISAALLGSFVLALTNATWHIPQLAFLTVLFIALLFKTEDSYANRGITS